MNLFLQHRLMAETDGEGSDTGGGAVDRGDDFTPSTLEDAVADEPADAKADATPDADADADKGDDEPKRDEKGRFIPKERFDEQVKKERAAREAAEARAAEAESRVREQETGEDIQRMIDEVKALRKSERKALLDGDEDKADSFSEKADELNRLIAERRTEIKLARAEDATVEKVRTQDTIDRLQQQYPQLDDSSDQFDEDLVDDVLALQRYYIQEKRMTPSKALTRAAERVMSDRQPAAAADAKGEKGLAAAQKADRKQAQVAKNVDAAKRQPASTKDVGMDSDKGGQKTDVDVNGMSFEEFKALPESTLKRLRGDMA